MGNNLTRKVTGGVCQRLKTPALAPAAKSRCVFVECIISTHLLVHTDGMQNILDRKKTKEENFWYLISKEWHYKSSEIKLAAFYQHGTVQNF